MTMLSLLPGPAETKDAARATGELLRLRWKMMGSARSRGSVILGLSAVSVVLYLTMNVGYAIRRFAENGVDTAAGQFAVNFVISLQRGELGAVGAAALGSALTASLFAPFTGASNLALANADELTAIRPPRLHRYFDALATQAFSTIGVLQLVSLTTVASLLTLDGNQTPGMVFAWSVWPVLILSSVAEGWLLELVHRRAGRLVRRTAGGVVLVVLVTALLLDPGHGKTLFGVGTVFSATVRAAGQGDTFAFTSGLTVMLVLTLVLFVVGITLARAALSLPAVPTAKPKPVRAYRMPNRPVFALARLLSLELIRTNEIRRPILTVLALGLPVVVFTHGSARAATTLVIACPLAVALSWCVNTFGVIGPAMPWLASQPHTMRLLPRVAIGTQVVMTLALAFVCWAPVAWMNPLRASVDLAAGLAVSTALTTRGSFTKSVRRPFLARLGSRGDTIVPPLAAVGYTIRFAFLAGQLGVLTLNTGADKPYLQALMVVWFTAWSALRTVYLLHRWDDPALRSSVIAAVASA